MEINLALKGCCAADLGLSMFRGKKNQGWRNVLFPIEVGKMEGGNKLKGIGGVFIAVMKKQAKKVRVSLQPIIGRA